MDLGKFVSDIKSKTIDPLLEEQAVAHLDGQLKRYQQETGNRLTDADFEEVNKSLTPDKIQSGYYAKEAIRDAIRSVPVAGKTIAGGIKSAAEIPALMLEIPKALYGASKAVPSPAELIMDTFAGRERVKKELDPVSQGLAQAGKFTRDLASDVTGIGEGQGFQDLPTGIGTVAGGLIGGAAYFKAIGAATEGALAANIFKDLTAKGIAKTAAQAGTKRFIAGTAANTIAGSPLSLAASMDDEGNINPKDLALNLTIDTAFGGVIEGAGALLTKNYGKQALKEAGRMAQGQEGFIFRGNSKESLKGIAETNRAFNRRNVEAYKAKGVNEARAAEDAKLAAAQKYEKIESDLMQARSLTEQRQGQLADEQARLGLKDETRQNVSTLNDLYEAEKQTAFKQVDAEQDKLVSEIQRESEQKTKDLVKQKADIDKQERTLTKPFDQEEKYLAKQQKQVNDSYQRAKKQAETEPVQVPEETPPMVAETPLVNSKNYEEEFNLFKEKTKTENEKIKVQIEQNKIKKINNLDNKIKQQQESYTQEVERIQKDYSNSIEELNKLPDSTSKQKKIDQAQKKLDRTTAVLNKKIQGIDGVRLEKIKQIEEQAASKFNTISANAEKALESERLRLTAQQEPLAKPTGLDQKANTEFNKFQKDLSSQAKTKIENIKVFKTKKTDALKLELQKLEKASAEADAAYNKIKRDFLQEGALDKFDETEKEIVVTKKKLDTLKKLYSQKLKEINETTNRQVELVKTKAEEQLKVQEDKVNALKQKRQDKRSKSGKSLTQEELNEIPSIKTANIALGKYKYQIKEVTQKKIARIKSFAKEKAEKLKLGLTEEKANFESLLQQRESLKPILDNPSLKKAEEQRNKTQEQLNKFKNRTYPERLKKLQETVANQIDTVKTKQQQALEAKQAEIGQLRADLETKRLQDVELQKQQIKEQRLKALDDEYNAARSDVDTRLSVTNANRNQAVSEFQTKKQALLEQQQKLEQELKDKVDYLNRRREVLKKQKEVALNRQFKKDALREYRAKMGTETPVLRNADDIEVDRMIAKEELDQIDSQLAELRNKANPPSPSELKTGIVARTGEEFYKDMIQAMYPNNKKLAAKVANHGAFINDVDIPTATTKPENIVLKKTKETGNFANDVLQPMISGLRDVSARLAGKVRQFEFMAAKKANKYLEPAATFFTKLNRFLTKEEKELFNSYIVKGDQESILAFLSKIDAQGKQYQELPALIKAPVKFLNAEDTSRDFLKHINKPLTEQWQAVRETLDDLHGQLEDAGVEVGYIQDYFPTSVKKDSVDTWREIFGIGTEERSAFDAALKQEKKKLGRDLDLDEENEFINKYLRGYGNTNSIPVLANLKARSGLAQGMEGLTFRDAQGEERLISTLYNDPSTTLENYINRAIFDIESRKFFGRTEEGLDTSIGAYVNDLMVTGQIKGSDVDKVKELLTARFVQGPKKPADFTRLGKDLAIGFALSDISSALVQVNEVLPQWLIKYNQRIRTIF